MCLCIRQDKALTNISLVDKNYALENNLNDMQEKMAPIIAQNLLLQEQMAMHNQGQGASWTLALEPTLG
jgi:hypothetical protein